MADLLRSQNLARVQGQQQTGQQQQFGLGGPQMGAPNQQPQFLDQAIQQAQGHMPNNFSNMAMQNMQQSLNSRNAVLQQAFQASQEHSRQLELIGLAQNQQPQNGINFAARLAQQQHQANLNGQPGQNPSSQPDIFSSPALSSSEGIRTSPSHSASQPPPVVMGTQHPPMQQNAQGVPTGRRPMTFQELRERAQNLQAVIAQQEQLVMQISNRRAGTPDSVFIPKMQNLTNEIKTRKEYLHKILQAMSQMHGISNANGPPGGNAGM